MTSGSTGGKHTFHHSGFLSPQVKRGISPAILTYAMSSHRVHVSQPRGAVLVVPITRALIGTPVGPVLGEWIRPCTEASPNTCYLRGLSGRSRPGRSHCDRCLRLVNTTTNHQHQTLSSTMHWVTIASFLSLPGQSIDIIEI